MESIVDLLGYLLYFYELCNVNIYKFNVRNST